MSDASVLVRLQEVDIQMLRLRKRLEDIPERKTLTEVLAKMEQIDEKSKQISAMRSECEVKLQKLSDEDAELAQKSDELQEKINTNSDFRIADSLAHELEGCAKRRNKVEFEHDKLMERIEKISAVEDQIDDATSKLEARKQKLEAQISTVCDEVEDGLAVHRQEYEMLASQLPTDLLERYEKTRKAKGGIGVGVLQGSHCSVCRVEFPEGKQMQLLQGPEIAMCPQCHRILVVEKE